MKLFLDDIRSPTDCAGYMHRRIGHLNPIYLEGNWYIVRSYNQFVLALTTYIKEITHVSFDHDLADDHYHYSMNNSKVTYEAHLLTVKEKTGLDCAKYLKEYYEEKKYPLPVMFVHSMNPVGTQNIIDLFNDKRTSQEGSPEPSN